ncbi:hypothetical protein D3C71_2028410 [compost metagenome]
MPGNLLTADPSDTLAADRTRFINESLVKFMSGKDPLTNWDTFLKTLDTKFDMQKYKDTAVKQFKEAGLIK